MSNAKENFSVADLNAALNARDRSNLTNVLKNKFQDLTGKYSNVLKNLSPNVRKRVEVLREIQTQHDDLEANFFEERAALVAKYQKLYQSLYTKRFEIVNGVVDVEGATTEAAAADEQVEKGVPDFWLTAMMNNEVLVEEITERDEEALVFLKDIKWSKIDNPKGFKLEFFFETNPYFKNTVLTKTYHLIDEDEPILEKAIGTEIEWYPGKCLTQKILKETGLKNAKPITKTEQCESFFNFFSPPQVPEDEDDIDKDAAEVLQNLMEQDYDVGSTIRDKIILHAVSWFTGEAAEDDYSDLEEDDEEDEEEEDENEEEEEDTKTKEKSATACKRSGRAPAVDGQFW